MDGHAFMIRGPSLVLLKVEVCDEHELYVLEVRPRSAMGWTTAASASVCFSAMCGCGSVVHLPSQPRACSVSRASGALHTPRVLSCRLCCMPCNAAALGARSRRIALCVACVQCVRSRE